MIASDLNIIKYCIHAVAAHHPGTIGSCGKNRTLDYTEKYHLDYTENKAHSLGVRKTVGVLSHKLSKPLMTFIFTSNYIPQANVV